MLKRRIRVSYRALKRQFDLDDDYLEDLKDAILYSYPQVIDEKGRGLVWTDDAGVTAEHVQKFTQNTKPVIHRTDQSTQERFLPPESITPDAERRQLTVMFCDLVGSTALSEQFDPEDLREIVQDYQQNCAEVIQCFDGYIAQLLGDALLVYFGWPQAHEDDAQRAVHAGLGMIKAMSKLNTRLKVTKRVNLSIRVGIHTGLVVVGDMGSGKHKEHLALGDTPNVASRLQGLAKPNTLVISAKTFRLVQGFFDTKNLGFQKLKGVAKPLQVYRVLDQSGALTRLDVAITKGLSPLVGREQEVELLIERWDHVKDGVGQVVIISGEAGIGKSRLVQVLKEGLEKKPHTQLECRGSPYFQNTALYPVIDLWERLCGFARNDSTDEKCRKLEETLQPYSRAIEETLPFFAALLSLPIDEVTYPQFLMSPKLRRQKTLETILATVFEMSKRRPLLFIMEDLQWVDPSTLELADMFIDQVPTTQVLMILTCRPTFNPPWVSHSYLTQITLGRLSCHQVGQVATNVASGKSLPSDVLQYLMAKTDGVPLFVEEITKAVLEANVLQEATEHYELTRPLSALSIPATLRDSLMARLDRLVTAKGIVQLAATIGRQFPYELLREIAHLDDETLQHELSRLEETELLYQKGNPPQAIYIFKHALIQEEAYQSLLKSKRRQYHGQIARALEVKFPEAVETQPELLAYHWMQAGALKRAIVYWQRAGEQAIARSAHVEAITHFTKGLEVLKTLPATPENIRRELLLLSALGPALITALGAAAPDVERAYMRARILCGQVGEIPQLFPVLWGLWRFYINRGSLKTAREIGENMLSLAKRQNDPSLLLVAHQVLGGTLSFMGEMGLARMHLEQDLPLTEPHLVLALRYGVAPRVLGLSYAAIILLYLGYPDLALRKSHEARSLSQKLSHPPSQAQALYYAALFHQRRREVDAVHEQTEALITLATEQGFSLWGAMGMFLRGWALVEQGHSDEGMAQMRKGLADALSMGAAVVNQHIYCCWLKRIEIWERLKRD